MKELEEHYDFKEVARRLGVHVDTVRRLVKAGRISPVRWISRQLPRVPASAVNRFLEARST